MSCEDRLIRGTVEMDGSITSTSSNYRTPSLPSRAAHSTATYVKHAILHPAPHLLALATAMFFGALCASIVIASVLFMTAELLLLTYVPRVTVFRGYVDAKLFAAKRLAAAQARASLLAKLATNHRRELERLELLVDRIRDTIKLQGSSAQLVVDDYLGLDRLIASYVRLAIAHRASSECLAGTDRAALQEDIRSLEAARHSSAEPVRVLAPRRLAIAVKRAERWDRSREDLDAMAHQLAMLADLVRLTHEQFAAPIDPRPMTEELDRAMEGLDENQGTLRELADFLVAQDSVEPGLLEMGRAASPLLGPDSLTLISTGSTISPVRIPPERAAICECQECRARRLVASLVPDSWAAPPARSA